MLIFVQHLFELETYLLVMKGSVVTFARDFEDVTIQRRFLGMMVTGTLSLVCNNTRRHSHK